MGTIPDEVPMTDGQAAETPPGTPSRRALGAMESAVRRARETQGGTASPPPPTVRPTAPSGPTEGVPPGPPRGEQPVARRHESWLLAAVIVAALLVVAGGIALAVSLGRSPSPSGPSSASGSPAHTSSVPQAGATGRTGGPTPSGTSGSTTTTTSSASAPAGAVGVPVITSLAPSSGSAGEGVQITGANFLSSDGRIVATFNGQIAPTSCPAQNTCTVTVPPQTGASAVPVSITTASGTSNAVTFTYGTR